jgi:hypothetical protein
LAGQSDKSPSIRRRGTSKSLLRHRYLVMLWSRAERLSAAAIEDRLASVEELAGEMVSRRTIERWMREAVGQGPDWTLATEPDLAAAVIVLRALGTLAWASGKPASITVEEAEWTIRLARAAPTIDPFVAYQVGILYRDRIVRGQETQSLDVYLGAAPWDDDKRYLNIIENGAVVEWFGLAWHPPG